MKIELKEIATTTIEEFADEHGLVMEVHERSPKYYCAGKWDAGVRYYAHFKKAEIKDGGMLASISGDGATPEEAIASYAQRISEETLVLNAWSTDRIEIDIPRLATKENSAV
jgi:hypothetical protein